LIVAIHKAIIASFSESDWVTLGYQTDTREWIEEHPRLLRSLRFSDDDYGMHVLSAIDKMLKTDPENINIILETPSIRSWLQEHEASLYAEFVGDSDRLSVASPSPKITSQVVEAAIRDAEQLLETRGATSGLDRVHTTLHGHLLAACDDAGL